MCDSWIQNYSKQFTCEGNVMNEGEGEYLVKGKLKGVGNKTILFWAPNPPTYNSSYTGSGIPYANADMAYDNTPNRGMVKTTNGKFEFKVKYPNSYYIGLGTLTVEPCCHIKICGDKSEKIHTIKLGNGIPFRMLTYPPLTDEKPRKNTLFYKETYEGPLRTQEKILRDSTYPEKNKMPDNFWGLKPPC